MEPLAAAPEEARGASLAAAVAHAVEAAVGHTQSVAFVDKCRTLDEVIEATREAAARESAAEAAVLRNELFAEAAAIYEVCMPEQPTHITSGAIRFPCEQRRRTRQPAPVRR